MIKQIKHRPNPKNTHQKQNQTLFTKTNHLHLIHHKKYQPVPTVISNSHVQQSYDHQDDENGIKREFMKTIVAINQNYFKQKLKIKNTGKPNKLRLLLPTRNTRTTYRTDYIKKYANTQSMKPQQKPHISKSNSNLWLNNGSVYMKEYNRARSSEKPLRKKIQISVDKDAPFFLESQYSHTFLNWGGQNTASSMKPSHCPAATNLPFSGKTSYQNDYCETGKKNNLTSRNVPMKSSQASILTNTNRMQVSYLTTSRVEYCQKRARKQQNCKPKINILGINPNKFRGKTQYQQQFHQVDLSRDEQIDVMPLEELSNFMTTN